MVKKLNKKGQVTIFIIIGIVIVAAAVLLYIFWPNVSTVGGSVSSSENPQLYLKNCLKETFENNLEQISMQGGSFSTRSKTAYNQGYDVQYLCYSSEYYLPCVVQKTMLKTSIEDELKDSINAKIAECANELKSDLESDGYAVQMPRKGETLELLPKRILLTLNYLLTISKSGERQSYDSLKISFDNNLYEVLGVVESIVNSEVTFGDSETSVYMTYYPWLKVEKKKQTDGTTIYILTQREMEEEKGGVFQFASRSRAWPPGYGSNVITYN